MRIDRISLADYRNFEAGELALSPDGVTAVVGDNGQGKTNLLEAVCYVATLESFRGATRDVLVREGATRAVVRAEGDRDGRKLLLEVEISIHGRDRAQLNRQPLRRVRDLLGALRVTIFSPDDLRLITDGPAGRRQLIDGVLASLQPRHDASRLDLERVLKQRASLLRQAAGRLDREAERTLDVFDARLVSIAEPLVTAREDVIELLAPHVERAHRELAPEGGALRLVYARSWDGPLEKALVAARQVDLRRATTTVGPHRDDVSILIGERSARTHCSRGEQRTAAISLRLGAHSAVTHRIGTPPVLLLDDVFSELDAGRASALVSNLPSGQALMTTSGPLPPGADPALVVEVRDGRLRARSGDGS